MVESRQPEVLAIVGAFTAVASLFVFMRVWSRFLGRNFCWDDYFIIASLVLLLADTVGTWVYILLSGTGYHVYDLPKKSAAEKVVALKWNFSVQMLYHPMMGLIRASIILFLFRMKDKRRRIRYSLWTAFCLNIMYTLGSSLTTLLQCTPTHYAWMSPLMDRKDAQGNVVPGGKCIDARTSVLTSCALSIFMDLVIIPIPSLMVWGLQMSRRTKMFVVIVMSLGWIATGVSVGRFIVYYYRFAPTMKDRTWDIGIAISIAEPATHVMTACAPATKCLFRYLFPQYNTDQNPGYNGNQYTYGHSEPRSRGSRTLGTFQLGLDDEELAVDPETGRVVMKSDVDLKPVAPRVAVHEPVAQRKMSCSKTACTEASEPNEVEPKHMLGQAR